MNAPRYREFVQRRLWPARGLDPGSTWCILDGARDERVFPSIRDSGLNYQCLYSGQIPLALRMAAPYLVELEQNSSVTGRLLDMAWGNSWGIFLRTRDPLRLRHHLKSFLRVRSPSGGYMLFRYYDPRVMRVYLPSCRPPELSTVFGPVDQYLVEGDEAHELMEFHFDGSTLRTRSHVLEGS